MQNRQAQLASQNRVTTAGNLLATMAADKTTQRWWAVCKPLQQPLKTRKKGEWWASMPELFHED